MRTKPTRQLGALQCHGRAHALTQTRQEVGSLDPFDKEAITVLTHRPDKKRMAFCLLEQSKAAGLLLS